ncbi:adaptor protein MecA [Schinkia sp. CFF1]
MEIERINEYTVKFYVTYRDIEDRGFDREEIWYNRERSEELFWEMMDEVNNSEDFAIEGPLWIQVQALDKGLEIVVTKAQVSMDGQKLELPIGNDKHIDLPVEKNLNVLLDEANQDNEHYEAYPFADDDDDNEEAIYFLIGFHDFEDVISLSHNIDGDGLHSSLYFFEGKYYLYIGFDEDQLVEEVEDDILCQILEFGFESRLSIHRVHEYGKLVMESNALQQIKQHFLLK